MVVGKNKEAEREQRSPRVFTFVMAAVRWWRRAISSVGRELGRRDGVRLQIEQAGTASATMRWSYPRSAERMAVESSELRFVLCDVVPLCGTVGQLSV